MSGYVLSCESTVDLTAEHLERREIPYIRYSYGLDGAPYRDDLFKTVSSEAFYQAMEEGAETKTSQINAAEYKEYFFGFLKAGKNVSAGGLPGAEHLFGGFPGRVLGLWTAGGQADGSQKTVGTIGSHTGPGTAALFFWGSPRTE